MLLGSNFTASIAITKIIGKSLIELLPAWCSLVLSHSATYKARALTYDHISTFWFSSYLLVHIYVFMTWIPFNIFFSSPPFLKIEVLAQQISITWISRNKCLLCFPVSKQLMSVFVFLPTLPSWKTMLWCTLI